MSAHPTLLRSLGLMLLAACAPGAAVPSSVEDDTAAGYPGNQDLEVDDEVDGEVDEDDEDLESEGAVEHTLSDPWAPADLEDVMAMAGLTAPQARLLAWQDLLVQTLDALVDAGDGCPTVGETEGSGATLWTGGCSAPSVGATVEGALSYGPEESAGDRSVVLVGDALMVTLSGGARLGLDGALVSEVGSVAPLDVDADWTFTGLGEDDGVVSLDLSVDVDEAGVGGGEGYIWVKEAAWAPTGDFSFHWTTRGVRETCPDEEELDLFISAASEVVVRSGGDTPCDGALSVWVDGVAW